MGSHKPSNEDAEHRDEDIADADSIELQSFEPVDTPRYVVRGTDGAWAGPVVPAGPVPERPIHLCPVCDYILTGLTSRRCPECGEPFTLAEARRRGLDTSPAMRRLYRATYIDRSGGAIGLILLIISVVAPDLTKSLTSGVPQPCPSLAGWVMFFLSIILLILGWMVTYVSGVNPQRMFLVVGILAMFVSLVLFVL